MTKEELLSTTFDSAPEAMHALEEFLKELNNNPLSSEGPGNYQHLRVIGNRVFE